MNVVVTLDNGEHVTGELYSLDIRHEHSDAYVRVNVAEIDTLEFAGYNGWQVIFPEEAE